MRIDTKGLDARKIALGGTVIILIILFSSLSLAGVSDVIKEKAGEHEILATLVDFITGDSTASSSVKSGSSSGSGTGSSAASGSTGTGKQPVDLYSLLKLCTEYYNNGIDEVPDVVKKIAGDDIILLDISMNDDSDLKIKVVTEDGLVSGFSKVASGETVDSTVTLTSNENTIRALLKSNDPLGYFVNALNQGSVNVECKGFVKKAALTALKSLA